MVLFFFWERRTGNMLLYKTNALAGAGGKNAIEEILTVSSFL